MAAGLSLHRDRIDAFRDAFNEAARSSLSEEDLIPVQRIDVIVTVDQLDERLERLLRYLEPCGPGNPGAVLGVVGGEARNPGIVGTNHVKFLLADATGSIESIGFGWGERLPEDWWRERVDVALRLERDEWGMHPRLQARIVDVQRGD